MYNKKFLEKTLQTAFKDADAFHIPKGITRHHANRGWWVRVRREGAKFHKFFTDNLFGSMKDSLKEAILYRHEVLSNFPIEKKSKFNAKTLDPDPEKRITRRIEKGKLRPYIYWKARWYDEEWNLQSVTFPVYTLGEEKAKALALETTIKNHNPKEKPPVNLTISDPYVKHEYRKELKSEIEFWAEYYAKTRVHRGRSQKISDLILEDPFSFEGHKRLVLHQQIERDPKLRLKKLEAFLEEHEKLFCELCSFSFKDNYPFLKKDIIEVHHIVPLSKLSKKTKVKLSDLMLLCSNCHFAIHQGNEKKNLEKAKEYFK